MRACPPRLAQSLAPGTGLAFECQAPFRASHSIAPGLGLNAGCPLRPGARSSARPEKAGASEACAPGLRWAKLFPGLACGLLPVLCSYFRHRHQAFAPSNSWRKRFRPFSAFLLFFRPTPTHLHFLVSFPVCSNQNNNRIDETKNFSSIADNRIKS